MYTIDQTQAMLDETAAELPTRVFEGLNGGVLLVPESKLHPLSARGDLYILGEYISDSMLGHYIAIYHGSLLKVYGHLAADAFRVEVGKVLKHELTHHLEGRAGDSSLVQADRREMREYLASKPRLRGRRNTLDKAR